MVLGRAGRVFVSVLSIFQRTRMAAEPGQGAGAEVRLQRWNEGWAAGRTAFHRAQPNEIMVENLAKVVPEDAEAESLRVFVPLCGKTVDLPFLAEMPWAQQVVGSEGVRQACDEFAAEQPDLGMSWREDRAAEGDDGAAFGVLSSEGDKVQLLQGDHFLLTPGVAGGQFDFVYDRASLVAISPDLREWYADVMAQLVRPGGRILLLTFDRRAGSEEARAMGPPFSVPESAVREIFEAGGRFEVTLLDDITHDLDVEYTRFKELGLTDLHELVFSIVRTDAA